jgi:transcriptional regulator with XRE-family HTH domain
MPQGTLTTPEQAFGEVLRRHRTANGLSQERLASMSRLDRTFISLLERGQRQPTLSTLLHLASALGIPASQLVREVEAALDGPDREQR